MKTVYPILLTEDKKGHYLVEVPDMDCVTEGKNLADAICMARDAIGIKGITMQDDGNSIPKASNRINDKKGMFSKLGKTIISYVDIDFEDYRRSIDNKIVRRNVSLPNWMDRAAEKEQLNVSKILQEAILTIVGKKYSKQNYL